MLKIFFGNDRVKAQAEIKRVLNNNYEVVEGAELNLNDLTDVFMGGSLLAAERKILVKDLSTVKENFDKLVDFIDTPNDVIVWENSLDKRTNTYKQLAKKIEIKEFKLIEKIDRNLAFNIYDTAFYDGKKAVQMLAQAELTEDPYKMLGAWAWKAIDNFKRSGGTKEKRVLKELSKLDIEMKTTAYQPWVLMQAFLLRAASL